MAAGRLPDEQDEAIRALIFVATRDPVYADRYLERAETLLAPRLPRARFAVLRADQRELERLADTIRAAAEHGDWEAVREDARRAAGLRARLGAEADVMSLGHLVYAQPLGPEPIALALHGVLDRPAASLARERAAVVEQLEVLVARDPEWADFYRARRREFARPTHAGEATGRSEAADPRALARSVLEAVAHGNFAAIEQLTARATPGANRRLPVAAGTIAAGLALGEPLPPTAVARAGELGLASELLATDPMLQDCLARSCGGGNEGPARDTPRAALRESLELLVRRPFVSSGGGRYLPAFDAEHLLVESFPEDDPDARTPLLALLGLEGRRGVSRVRVEAALARGTSRVCAALGLDPFVFTVACIPFDAYLRLAPAHGWGRAALWTHFDGYQVAPDLHLRALVGGDVRYGGPDDVCSVSRHYDSEHLTVRFAVVRRARLAPAA